MKHFKFYSKEDICRSRGYGVLKRGSAERRLLLKPGDEWPEALDHPARYVPIGDPGRFWCTYQLRHRRNRQRLVIVPVRFFNVQSNDFLTGEGYPVAGPF